uniref:THAP9-like helix-turn-helix domain-containing protein n=1 Tax=Ixodes ricinus TaxID=34613 RepID=V5HUS5_IXORI
MPLKKRPLQDTLQGTVAPQESPEKDSGLPCSYEASPALASLSGALEESNGTVNRLLDSGSSQFTTTAAEALFLHTYCGDETTSPHLSKVARELQDVKQKLYAANRRLRRRDQTIRQQRTTIDELQRQVSLLKHASEEFRVSNCLPTDLIRDWHENASRMSRAHRYRPMTLEFASGLHACSPRAYRYVGEWLPMPSMQLVRKHGVGTAVSGISCVSSENLESFDEGCETRVSETQQALAALGASVTAGSMVNVEVGEQDDVLLSHRET